MDSLKSLSGEWDPDDMQIDLKWLSLCHYIMGAVITTPNLLLWVTCHLLPLLLFLETPCSGECGTEGKTNVNLTYNVKKGKNKDWFMRDIWPVVETIGSFRKEKVNCTYTKTNKTTRLGIPSAELTMQFISQILSNCVLCRLVLEARFTWKGFSY